MLNSIKNDLLQKNQLDHKVLRIRKNNPLLKKLESAGYLNMRKLAILGLYLGGGKSDDSSKMRVGPIFRNIAEKEVEKILSYGIKKKTLDDLLGKAHKIFFDYERKFQYSFDFEFERNHDRALDFLDNAIRSVFDHTMGDIRGYMISDVVLLGMIEIVTNCGFRELYHDYIDFMDSNIEKDNNVSTVKLRLFYIKLKTRIAEDKEKEKGSIIRILDSTRIKTASVI